MIPASFDYTKPRTLEAAKAALADAGTEAVVLAGGQSLLTDLKLRRKRPALVVDIGGVGDLRAVSRGPTGLMVGAMASQANVASSEAAREWPLLAQVAEAASDPMVRHRGTLVGAFCEADPAGDWVACGLALDATLELDGPNGIRRVSLSQFVTGPETTALETGEIAVRAHLPPLPNAARTTYRKVTHAAVGWSVASAAIVFGPGSDGGSEGARIAVSGAVSHPQRLPRLEQALRTLDLADRTAVDDAITTALSGLAFRGDAYASADYRAERLKILLRRALIDLSTPAREQHSPRRPSPRA